MPTVWRLLLYVMVPPRSDFAAQAVVLSGGIVLPLKWSKVRQVIRTTLGNGSNVINLPSILTGSVTIVFPTNPGTTLVFTPHSRVIVNDCLCLLPDSKFCFLTEICHCVIEFSSCCLNSTAELYSSGWFRCSGTWTATVIKYNKCAKSYIFEQKPQIFSSLFLFLNL